MRTVYRRLVVLSLWILTANIQAELLVVKKIKDADGKEIFAPLDDNDNTAVSFISSILLKYQWPMCVASDLTETEKNALLTPIDPQDSEKFGKVFPEEAFIQNKITQLLKNANYQVVFIPPSIYELFCIYEYIKTLEQANPLQNAVTGEKINLFDILNESFIPPKNDPAQKEFFKFSATIRQQVFKIYKDINNRFFSKPGATNAAFYVNNKIATFLFATYEEFKNGKDALTLSDIIKNKSAVLVTYLVNEINNYDMSKYDTRLPDLYSLKKESDNNIIPKVVALEYEARALNKGLLFRGTTLVEAQVGFGTKEKGEKSEQPKQRIAGSTLKAGVVEEEYGQKSIRPYSISFGTSLFAGAIFDHGACAYNYLAGEAGFMSLGKKERTTGYVLLIDKNAYFENQNNNLFSIPPLAPIAGLFQQGEYFHARTKAATISKKGWGLGVIGLSEPRIQDPTGVLLITRDPLEHAALFSRFVADNGRIIQLGDESSLSEEEKAGVLQAQKKVAEFYKSLKAVAKPIEKAKERRMQKISEKRS